MSAGPWEERLSMYEIVTVAGIKKTLSFTTPFSQILKEAAKIKG